MEEKSKNCQVACNLEKSLFDSELPLKSNYGLECLTFTDPDMVEDDILKAILDSDKEKRFENRDITVDFSVIDL